MPRSYPAEAVAACQQLYLRFNGQNYDRIEKEMRKQWPGWSRQNLVSRGDKLGWVDKYGWEAALKLHLATRPEAAQTATEAVFSEIEVVRKRIFEQLKKLGATAERDLVYQHRDYTKLSIEALAKLGAGDTLQGFIAFWERLMDMLPGISEKAAKALIEVSDAVLDKAAAQYGETETESQH